eukprot:TRINITY_DN28249_c0_g1_i1.p1 TRINITY_DN28249_c0_g1~~TRINITY_DN28249_c0_g1_i1.p1  ORF type:complete len:250 (-),score=39.82 TRINITY_DN28249_c0_g1_i1:21-770(-)
MIEKIKYIAALSFIDAELDEMQEEYGDLPARVKDKEDRFKECGRIVDETENILTEIKNFVSTAKVTLVELKEREDELTKQQFLVRNNKEFDAITKEIEHLKNEHEKLSARMRTEGVKEENILRILKDQIKDKEESEKDLEKINKEFEIISAEQSDDVKNFNRARKKIYLKLDTEFLNDYDRVRSFHKDAAVQMRKNSCAGCFSSVPSQKIVELRNNLNKMYTCENCGRILIPDEMEISEQLLIDLGLED